MEIRSGAIPGSSFQFVCSFSRLLSSLHSRGSARRVWVGTDWSALSTKTFFRPTGKRFEIEVDHGRNVECLQLRDDKTAYDGKSERPARLATSAVTNGNRQRGHERGHCRHHNGAEAKQ